MSVTSFQGPAGGSNRTTWVLDLEWHVSHLVGITAPVVCPPPGFLLQWARGSPRICISSRSQVMLMLPESCSTEQPWPPVSITAPQALRLVAG